MKNCIGAVYAANIENYLMCKYINENKLLLGL